MKPLGRIKRLNPRELWSRSLAAVDERIAAERPTFAAHLTVKSALISVLLTGEVRVMPDEEGA